jgi:ribosomal protein L40E
MDIVFWFLAIAFVLFLMVAMSQYDRQRIREQVEAHGGKVIEISGRWFGGSRYGRTYDVTYTSHQGRRITATCMTNMFRAVQWISDRPPGSYMETSEAAEESGRFEAIECIACGAKIPARDTRCPHCGWSYKGN